MIGIYWLTPDRTAIFHAASVDLVNATDYGDWKITPDDHVDVWEVLRKEGKLRALPAYLQDEYFSIPRGRISYNKIQQQYYVYHGNWYRAKLHKKLLLACFDLSAKDTTFECDEHYTL
ncbi:MAG: hypothetical protein Ta2G_09770 [Termitinemataceae bacterium]|nr:MAG: hypothetical protein Ta2G_09770 [Termitinemataceae bacterium]